MRLIIDEIGRQLVPDEMSDFREQEPNQGDEDAAWTWYNDRLEGWKNDQWSYVGVTAVATVRWETDGIPGSFSLIQTIASPGLWGVEDDSGETYLESIYQEELDTLRDMLKAMGFSDEDIEEKL